MPQILVIQKLGTHLMNNISVDFYIEMRFIGENFLIAE